MAKAWRRHQQHDYIATDQLLQSQGANPKSCDERIHVISSVVDDGIIFWPPFPSIWAKAHAGSTSTESAFKAYQQVIAYVLPTGANILKGVTKLYQSVIAY
jgi:hypothetical protein